MFKLVSARDTVHQPSSVKPGFTISRRLTCGPQHGLLEIQGY